MRLPTLNLEIFSGNELEWNTFWDVFESEVHSDANMADVSKHSYLKGQDSTLQASSRAA